MSLTRHPTLKDIWIIRLYAGKRTKDPITGKANNARLPRIYFPGTEAQATEYYRILLQSNKPTAQTAILAPTLSQAWPAFCDYYKNHVSDTTYRDFLGAWRKHLHPYYGRLRPLEFTPALIEQYKSLRRTQKSVRNDFPKPKTINKELSYLAALVTWMAKPEQNLCQPLPFTIHGFPARQTKAPLPRVPIRAEVLKLLRNSEPQYRGIFACCYYAGLRKSETLRLTVADVNLPADNLIIFGKRGKYRIVPIHRKLRPYLRRRIRHSTGHLFINPDTNLPWVDVKKALNRAVDKAGLAHTWLHLLRHAFGTHLIQSGVDLESTRILMGHESTQVTQMYLTLGSDFLNQQLQRLGSGAPGQKSTKKIK